MTYTDETTRLSPEDWRDAVDRAFHVHDEAHAISTVRARKHIPALVEMVSECGVSGLMLALGSAILLATQKGWDRADRDPLTTRRTSGRVKRFVRTLRLREAETDVRSALAPEYDFDEADLAA